MDIVNYGLRGIKSNTIDIVFYQEWYYEGDTPLDLYLVREGSIKTIKIAEEMAEATEDTLVYLLPKDQIITVLYKYPEISTDFIKLLSNHVHEKEEQMLELAYHSVRKRVAIFFPREELAEIAGIAVETVSRTLTEFTCEGFLEKNGDLITLLNAEKLSKMKN